MLQAVQLTLSLRGLSLLEGACRCYGIRRPASLQAQEIYFSSKASRSALGNTQSPHFNLSTNECTNNFT